MFRRRLAWFAIAFAVSGCRSGSRSEEKRPTPTGSAAATPKITLPDDPYVDTRLDMVRRLEALGTSDARVLTAMRLVPRHEFVPPDVRSEAYRPDRPQPIGFGLTISAPNIVAMMTEAAHIKPGDKVLEIGTGSGYQAAVLAMMGAKVYSIEIHPELAARTRKVLDRTGFSSVQTKVADGWYGWPDAGPFAAVLITCATPIIPDKLVDQLQMGGRIVLPLGEIEQELVVAQKTPEGLDKTEIEAVRFSLMRGAVEDER